jgi:hypothetical protein
MSSIVLFFFLAQIYQYGMAEPCSLVSKKKILEYRKHDLFFFLLLIYQYRAANTCWLISKRKILDKIRA